MNKLHQGVKRFLSAFIFIAAIFMGNHVLANEAILSSIEISPATNNSYNIKLDTNQKISLDKKVISDNKILLTVKNTKPANDIKMVYQNIENIDHVIFYPKGKSLQVEVMGENLKNANISILGNIEKTSNNWVFTAILTLTGLLAAVYIVKISKKQKRQLNFVISNLPEDNRILKVEFERRHGLIAQHTGIQKITQMRPRTSNVQRVDFGAMYGERKEVKI